ncbi:MAG TPA: aminopeptidase [Thermoplasmata archaeon]|jgi:leucyl aminopeptidase (aminopeptidase T)|nr:aminopeptidase [Thermoplasmata archaeon]
MFEPSPREADRLARRVLTTRLGVKAGENVTIEVFPSSLPWATGFVREARRLGASPLVHYEDEDSYWAAVDDGKADLIGNPGSHEWATLDETDAYVFFWGPEDESRMRQLPDQLQERLTAYNMKWYERARKAGVRGVRMAIARVTPENARRWGVSLDAWRKELLASSSLDPRAMARDAERIRKAMEGGGEVRVRHPNGTDLRLRLKRRNAMVVTGSATPEAIRKRPGGFGFMANVPDGSVFVAPDEKVADGTVVSNRNVAGFPHPVKGGRWTFRGGRLVAQSYGSGSALLKRAYSEGKKGRDLPAMVEVGLDPTTHMAPGMQENERGAVSIGIGSNMAFGGSTEANFNAILTVPGAELSVDGRIIVRNGRIL